MVLVGVVALLAFSAAARATESVGAQSCATCHEKVYQIWSRGPHAKALERLAKNQQNDARCVRCHAPDQQAGFTGVQCEACHGPGRYYARDYVMRDAELSRLVGMTDVTTQTCEHCHTPTSPGLTPFDFDEKAARILHWAPKPAEPKAPAG